MGDIKAHTHVLISAELCDKRTVNEKIVKTLASEVPWEGRHGLRDDLHFACSVQGRQTFFESLLQWCFLVAVEMAMFREPTNVGHQQHRFGTSEPVSQITGNINDALKFGDGVQAVGIINSAKVERVVSSKQFGGVNDKTDVLLCIENMVEIDIQIFVACLLYTSPSPRDLSTSRMPSSA